MRCCPSSLRLLWVWSISSVECSFCVLSSPQWVSIPGIYPVSTWVLVNLYHPKYPLGAGFVALPLTGWRAVSFCYSSYLLTAPPNCCTKRHQRTSFIHSLSATIIFCQVSFLTVSFPLLSLPPSPPPTLLGGGIWERGRRMEDWLYLGVFFASIPYTQLSTSLLFKHPVFKFNISYSDTFTVFHHNLHTTDLLHLRQLQEANDKDDTLFVPAYWTWGISSMEFLDWVPLWLISLYTHS